MLCGLAFAGKTTVGGAIAAKLPDAVVISLDELNARRGLAGGLGIPEHEWAKTHAEALAELEGALATGRSAIVDDTNCFRFLRDNYRAVAARHGGEVLVVHVATPFALALARLRENAASATRPAVREEILLALAAQFEPPGEDERALVLPAGVGVAAWVAGVFGAADTSPKAARD